MFNLHKSLNLAFFILVLTIFANSQTFNSILRFNSSDASYINQIEIDAQKNKYILGNFKYSLDCDPSPGTYTISGQNNLTTGFIIKLDSLNTLQWAYPLYFGAFEMSIDSKGNVYLFGGFDGIEDFDLGSGTYTMTASSSQDAFVLKMNKNGQFIYAFKLGAGTILCAEIDSSNAILVAGSFSGTIDFDPGPGVQTKSVSSNSDGFIAKYDSTGSFLYVNQFSGVGDTYFRKLMFNPNNGILYLFGQFSQTVDFNPNLTQTTNLSTSGLYDVDIFLARFNFAGNLIWVKQFGGTSQESATTCVMDNKANVYFAANFKGTADFDPSPSTFPLTATFSNYNDAVVCKVDRFGNFKWANHIATPLNTFNTVTYNKGLIYSAGSFESYLKLPTSTSPFYLPSNGGKDGFIYISDTTGAFVGARGFGGLNDQSLAWVLPDTDTSVYITGSINGTVDFDLNQGVFNQTSTGNGADAFMAHYTFYKNSTGVDIRTACDSLQWIDSTTYYNTNKLASHFVLNAQGKDSLVNLNLTIYDSKYVVDSILSCDPITWIDGVTYASSTNIPQVTLSSAQGCDSVVTLHFTRMIADPTVTVISPTSLSSNCQNCSY